MLLRKLENANETTSDAYIHKAKYEKKLKGVRLLSTENEAIFPPKLRTVFSTVYLQRNIPLETDRLKCSNAHQKSDNNDSNCYTAQSFFKKRF